MANRLECSEQGNNKNQLQSFSEFEKEMGMSAKCITRNRRRIKLDQNHA
jgi:hypothetical protein